MSAVIVVTPVIIASWPAIAAAISAAIGTAGFALSQQEAQLDNEERSTRNRAEIDVEDSEILAESAGLQQEIVVERDGVTARFSRDARGALRVCMEGEGYSKAQLKQIGDDLIGRVTQQYVYHRVVSEMKDRNMTVVHEEVDEDRTVRIRVRNW
jgi:hypothetical protein